MGRIGKYKNQNNNKYRRIVKEHIRQRYLRQDTKITIVDTFDYIKTNNFCSLKDIDKKVKRNSKEWNKYLQYKYPKKELSPEYTNNL